MPQVHIYDWVPKLAAISSCWVLLEGPVDMTCIELEKLFPEEWRAGYTRENLLKAMSRYFDLVREEPAVSGEPHRFVFLFRRRLAAAENRYQFLDLPYIRSVNEGSLFVTDSNLLCKVYQIGAPREIDIEVASYSPVGTPVEGMIEHEGKFLGWMEKILDGDFFTKGSSEEDLHEILHVHFQHELFLVRNGYFDLDCAAGNFIRTGDGRIVMFDKNQTMPIKLLSYALVDLYRTYGLRDFGHLVNCPFMQKIRIYEDRLLIALNTKNSAEIEQALLELLKGLS